jgi:hypothetical protein
MASCVTLWQLWQDSAARHLSKYLKYFVFLRDASSRYSIARCVYGNLCLQILAAKQGQAGFARR